MAQCLFAFLCCILNDQSAFEVSKQQGRQWQSLTAGQGQRCEKNGQQQERYFLRKALIYGPCFNVTRMNVSTSRRYNVRDETRHFKAVAQKGGAGRLRLCVYSMVAYVVRTSKGKKAIKSRGFNEVGRLCLYYKAGYRHLRISFLASRRYTKRI